MDFPADVASLLTQHAQRATTLWSFQVLIVLGVLGWVFTHPKALKKDLTKFVLFAGLFVVFVFSVLAANSIQSREDASWNVLVAKATSGESLECISWEKRLFNVFEFYSTSKNDGKHIQNYLCALKPSPWYMKLFIIVVAYSIVLFAVWTDFGRSGGKSKDTADKSEARTKSDKS